MQFSVVAVFGRVFSVRQQAFHPDCVRSQPSFLISCWGGRIENPSREEGPNGRRTQKSAPENEPKGQRKKRTTKAQIRKSIQGSNYIFSTSSSDFLVFCTRWSQLRCSPEAALQSFVDIESSTGAVQANGSIFYIVATVFFHSHSQRIGAWDYRALSSALFGWPERVHIGSLKKMILIKHY